MASPLEEDEFIPDDNLEFIPDLKNLDSIEPSLNQPTFPDSRINQSKSRSHSKSIVEEETLSLFINKNIAFPKKEYLRIQLIRSFKRAIREGLIRKVPNKKLGEVIPSSQESLQSWKDFMSFINQNCDFWINAARTDNGPKTEAKSKRTNQSDANSFNDNFCRDFFSEPFVLESYFLFVEVIFACFNCKVLSRKFNFTPKIHRNGRSECQECEESWIKLKMYVKDQMIKDLGVFTSKALDVV